jgi:hypothetical protein
VTTRAADARRITMSAIATTSADKASHPRIILKFKRRKITSAYNHMSAAPMWQ